MISEFVLLRSYISKYINIDACFTSFILLRSVSFSSSSYFVDLISFLALLFRLFFVFFLCSFILSLLISIFQVFFCVFSYLCVCINHSLYFYFALFSF